MDFMVGCAHLRCFVARVRLRLKEPVLFFIIFFPRKGGGKPGFAGFAAHTRSKSASRCGPEAQHPGTELQALGFAIP